MPFQSQQIGEPAAIYTFEASKLEDPEDPESMRRYAEVKISGTQLINSVAGDKEFVQGVMDLFRDNGYDAFQGLMTYPASRVFTSTTPPEEG